MARLVRMAIKKCQQPVSLWLRKSHRASTRQISCLDRGLSRGGGADGDQRFGQCRVELGLELKARLLGPRIANSFTKEFDDTFRRIAAEHHKRPAADKARCWTIQDPQGRARLAVGDGSRPS